MILTTENINNLNQTCFLDSNGTGIARYDRVKYNVFARLTKEQKGFFWQPEEINLSKDNKDYSLLSSHEKDIFRYNLMRQIVLDSVQGRAPSLAFLPICSLPELESWIVWWTASEQVHSDSYTYIIRNLYPNPSIIFDGIMDIKEIVDCAKDISLYYDVLIEHNQTPNVDPYKHKESIWLALNAVNALEGIRFYVSFACSWAFAELGKMEGNAKIIRLICRDENLHLGSTQTLIKILPKDDPDFAKISKDPIIVDKVRKIFEDVINQEKQWAKFLFKKGSMIGLSEQLLVDYVDYISYNRMMSAGVEPFNVRKNNPLPWTQNWISSKNLQVTPQETELTTYVIGGVNQDVSADTFRNYSL
jgi:ribonucleoside-diphosphate reductase beta chain